MPGQVVCGPFPLMFISRNPQPVCLPVEGTSSGPPPTQRFLRVGRGEMRSEDLMSPDLLSEIVLLGFGTLILASLLVFVMTALTRT